MIDLLGPFQKTLRLVLVREESSVDQPTGAVVQRVIDVVGDPGRFGRLGFPRDKLTA